MDMKKRVLSVITGAAMVFSAFPMQAAAAEDTVTVTVFTTNDIHGIMDGEGTVGIVKAAAMKASTPNSLLADAGDATQGASFATISQGEDVIKMMNAAGYDVMAAGNHEFDYGIDRLLSNAAAADFPVLGANVTVDGKDGFESSTVIESGGKSIGFIGLTTADTATSTNPANLKGVSFGDEVAAAKEQIDALDDSTDAIVIICHMGNNDAAVNCTSKDLLDSLSDEELAEVTAVIDGHSHTVEQENYTRGDISVPVVQTGVMFTAIGKLEISFDGDEVSASCSVLDADAANAYEINEAGQEAAERVQAALDDIRSEQEEVLGEVLCENDTPLWGGNIYWDYSEPRVVETSYGDFVTDAFAEYAKIFSDNNGYSMPIVAVENGGGISMTLPMGKVTRGDVLNAFNHGNLVYALEVSPSLLRLALENGIAVTGQDETGLLIRERVSGSFLQVSGFTYTYDPSAAEGEKVVSIKLNDGTELDLSDSETKLLVATNSYVGEQFISAGAVKLGELGGEDQIVSDYILSLTSGGNALDYDSGDDRILISDDKSPETYTVTIPVLFDPDGTTPCANGIFHVSVDGAAAEEVIADANGNIVLEVAKGEHTFALEESSDGQPVYTNNYSGSGTVTTKDGYYRLSFMADGSAITVSDEQEETAETSADEETAVPDKSTNIPPTGNFPDIPMLAVPVLLSGCIMAFMAGIKFKMRKDK